MVVAACSSKEEERTEARASSELLPMVMQKSSTGTRKNSGLDQVLSSRSRVQAYLNLHLSCE